MSYIDTINEIIKDVNKDLLNLSIKRVRGSAPTQVSSEFLTNKEQGDWAELTFIKGINNFSKKYIAVKYGRDDDLIAGEPGFNEFYEQYQDELDTIGKRPDVLIFDRKDFNFDTINISHFNTEILDKLVPKAKCGIEVRSSSFLMSGFYDLIAVKVNSLVNNIFSLQSEIISEYSQLLQDKKKELFDVISQLNLDNVHTVSFRSPSWKKTAELVNLSSLLKELNKNLKELKKRNFLSFTPKVEDLKVVYNWVKRYNVPHYYVQVFFDSAFGISYEDILKMICNEDLKGKDYFIGRDVKNQNKITIKINIDKGKNIFENVTLPNHRSQMKELGRGRLLYYVTFENSLVTIINEEFEKLFGFALE